MSGASLVRRAVTGLAAGAMVAASLPAPGAAQSSGAASPVEVIRERNRAVQELLAGAGDSLSADQREELKDLLNGFIDFRELSRRSLGEHWDERSAEERREFVDVFRRLIRASSVEKIGVHRADSVTYRGAEVSGDEAEVVTVAHRGEGRVEIVYRMHRADGEWKAYDIVIDGASTVRTYRDSFRQQLARRSYEEMYRRLEEKAEEEAAGPG